MGQAGIPFSRHAREKEPDPAATELTPRTGLKIYQRRFRLDVGKRFFTEGVVGHWDRLPRAVVTALSLMEFRKCWDNALRH